MAFRFVEKPHCGYEKTAIISNVKHSPVISETTEITKADDNKRPNECKHFTIRGYVAEVRKRNTKICWPFLLHKNASPESPNAFPPLPVAKFRWWGCQHCVCEIIAATTHITTGGAMSTQNQILKSTARSLLRNITKTYELDTRQMLPKFPQISLINNQKEIFKTNDCSVKAGKEKNECLRKGLIKEGFQKCMDGLDHSNEIQNAVGEAKCVPIGRITINKGKRKEKKNSVSRKKIGLAYLKDVFDTALVKHEETKLFEIGHSKMLCGDAISNRIKFALCRSNEDNKNERRRAEKISRNCFSKERANTDLSVRNNNVFDAYSAHTMFLGACCQDNLNNGASVGGSMHIRMTDGNRGIENKFENTHSKKIKKVRLLEDIIRNEVQHSTGNICSLDGDADIRQHDFLRSVMWKEKILLLNHSSYDVHQSNASNFFRSNGKFQKSTENEENMDDAVLCLGQINDCSQQFNQPKSVKRKNRHENLSDQAERPLLMSWQKKIPNRANLSDRETKADHISGSFCLSRISSDLSHGMNLGVNIRDNAIRIHKQNSVFRKKKTLAPKDDFLASSFIIGEEVESNNFTSQDVSLKKAVTIERTKQCSVEISDGSGNAISHSTRNKRPLDGRLKTNRTKKKASLETREKVSTCLSSVRTTEHESHDEIPMDIVEFLARNLHDRCHLVAGSDAINKSKFPSMTESIKNIRDINSSQLNRDTVINADHGNLSCQKFQVYNKSFDVLTTIQCNREMEHEMKACSCSIYGKKKLQIDLNKQYSDSLLGESGSCNLDTNGNCHQLNFSCCRSNNIFSSRSFLEDQMGSVAGVKSRCFDNINFSSVLAGDLHLSNQLNDYERQRNQVEKHHRWIFSPVSPNASSFLSLTNGCHSSIMSANLYSNDSISALNLLRLMDQAAGKPLHHSHNYSGFIKETNKHVNGLYNESQEEYDNLELERCIYPMEIVKSSTCQQPKSSCSVFRPLPRIGVLGPSLQNEILSFSKCSRLTSKNSNEFKTDVNEKLEPLSLNPNTLAWNSCNSFFSCKCSGRICPDGGSGRCFFSNTRINSVASSGAPQVELNDKVDILLPIRSFCKMDICAVNRNPADFTVLDENNEYMIDTKELKPESAQPYENLQNLVLGQKKQRTMKLDDLKAFPMR